MDVWFTWGKRRAQCRWCDKTIEKATPMVKCKLWRKGDENSRRINIQICFHPDCYLAQGLDYLSRNPYVPSNYIRISKLKKRELSDEDRRTRYLLLRRKAALEQRKRKLTSDYPDRLLVEVRIDKKITDLMELIMMVGGVPKSWVK